MKSPDKFINVLTTIGKYSLFALAAYFLIGIVFGVFYLVTGEARILVNYSYGQAIGPMGFIMRWAVTLFICFIQGLLWMWQILVTLIALLILSSYLEEKLQKK